MSQSLPPKNDFEHVRGPCNSTYAVNLTYDRHTDIYIRNLDCKYNLVQLDLDDSTDPKQGKGVARIFEIGGVG